MMTMFVDPGLGGTGVAIFENIQRGAIEPPVFVDRITIDPKKGPWVERSIQVAAWIQMVVIAQRERYNRKGWQGIVIEFPEVWSGSLKSNTAVRAGKGGTAPLLKLASLTGMIAFSFLSRMNGTTNPTTVVCYTKPSEWKGQLPKEAVISRICAAYTLTPDMIRDHEADAIGMGLAYQKGGKI